MASTATDFVVRPYATEDNARLLELIRQVWSYKQNVDAHFHQRWWWRWDQPPLYLVEDSQGTLIGLCAYLPFTLRARGRDLSCAWFVDFYVLPHYQGRGLGRRLTQVVQNQFSITASLSQTAMAYRVFHKMGWRERTSVKIYVNPFPLRWMFRRRTRGLRLSRVAVDPTLPVAGDLDSLWTRVRDSYACVALRSSAEILKRYARHGERNYVLLCCYRGQECVGYMVVRVAHPASINARSARGLIVDYLVHPDDGVTFAALLSEAASVLMDQGVAKIYCVSTSARCERILAFHGFLSPATPLIGRVLQNNNKSLTYYPNAESDVIDPAAWFLTMGDCDIDYAWD